MPPRSGRFLTAPASPFSSTSTSSEALGAARPQPASSARRELLDAVVTMPTTYKPSVRPLRHLAPESREQLAEAELQGDLERQVLREPRQLGELATGIAQPSVAQVGAVRRERTRATDVTEPATEGELAKDRQRHADRRERVVDEQRSARLDASAPAAD